MVDKVDANIEPPVISAGQPITEPPVISSGSPINGSSQVIAIPRVLFNYAVIAVVCLVMGVVIGMVAYDRVAQSNLTQTENLINKAVATAVAAQPQNVAADPNARKDVSIDNRPSLGPKDAPVVMVEFGDFHCTFCKRFHDETITPLLQHYGDKVLYVFRDYPILGPDSTQAALAADCAYDQDAFWDFHDRLFSDPTQLTRDMFLQYATALHLDVDQFTKCYDDATHQVDVTKDYNDAEALGVGGTPTFFINGKMLVGAQPYATFAAAIDTELTAPESTANATS